LPKGVPRAALWTPEQIAILVSLGPTVKGEILAREFGKTHAALRAKASALGIRMRFPLKYYGIVKSSRDVGPSRSPSLRDLEWAAGFLEGEGHFRSSRVEAKQISTTEPLERLLAIFGGHVETFSMEYRRQQGGKANDGSIWGVGGARARGVMMTLFPLLSTRRKAQIRGALTWQQ